LAARDLIAQFIQEQRQALWLQADEARPERSRLSSRPTKGAVADAQAGVKARYRKKFKVTTNSDHKQTVFDNVLAREFTAVEPDRAYVGDITYIWTREGCGSFQPSCPNSHV
jgi:transposase InsO family protein